MSSSSLPSSCDACLESGLERVCFRISTSSVTHTHTHTQIDDKTRAWFSNGLVLGLAWLRNSLGHTLEERRATHHPLSIHVCMHGVYTSLSHEQSMSTCVHNVYTMYTHHMCQLNTQKTGYTLGFLYTCKAAKHQRTQRIWFRRSWARPRAVLRSIIFVSIWCCVTYSGAQLMRNDAKTDLAEISFV